MDAFSAIAFIAERKIEEAMAEGQFDNLPGTGKPLELEDLSHLPPDMRMAYTILKNSGYIEAPPAKDAHANMRDLLSGAADEKACYAKMQRLKVMMSRVERAREQTAESQPEGQQSPAASESSPYLEKILAKV